MSYTTKIILIWLSVWLALALILLVIGSIQDGIFLLEEGLIGFSLLGFFFSAIQFLVGAVILLTGFLKNTGRKDFPDDLLDADDDSKTPSFREQGLAHLAAGGLTLLIGGSVCFSLF